MPRKPENRRRSTLGQIQTHRDHWRARYTRHGQTHTPGHTFSSFALADQWLADEQRLIDRDEWTPPAQRRAEAEAVAYVDALTLADYAERHIAERRTKGRALAPRTAEHYRDIAARWLTPLDARPVTQITRADVAAWYAQLPDHPTMRKHSYAFLRQVMGAAVREGLIEKNPVDIPGASAKTTPAKFVLPTADQVAALADAMPPEHRLAVLLAAWCGLRFGEVSALRRSDLVTTDEGMTLRIRRGVVRVGNRMVEGPTKSAAGERDVIVPPHIVADVKAHLKDHAQWGKAGLLFPSTTKGSAFLTQGQLAGHKTKLYRNGTVKEAGSGFRGALEAVGGLEGVTFHKLRHFAGTNLAVAGATTKELMDFMGHADLTIAMRYQHTAQNRAELLAARMSAIAAAETGTQPG